MPHNSRIYFSILLIILYFPLELAAQHDSYLISAYIQFPDTYSNRSCNDVLQDQKGAVWIANNTGLYLYDGVKCQLYSNTYIHTMQTGAVYQLAEDAQQRLWLKTARGLFVLKEQRNQLIPLRSIGIPDSILRAHNLNFCSGASNDIFILAGNTLYTYDGISLRVWASYNFSFSKKAILLYDKKKQRVYAYSPGDALLICDQNGGVINPQQAQWGVKKTNYALKNIHLYLSNALADSVSIFAALEPDGIVRLHYDSAKAKYIGVSTQHFFDGFSLLEILRSFISKHRPDLSPYKIRGVRLFKISSDIMAISSSEGIFLVKIQPYKFSIIKESLGQRIRAIQEDTFGHLIFGTYEGTKYLHKQQGQLRQLSSNHLYAWSILPISAKMDQFIMQGENKNNLYFIQSSPREVRISKQINNIGKNGASSYSSCMAPDTALKGIWHITNNNHLAFYNISNGQNQSFSPAINERGERAMIRQDDHIWIGGFNGLQLFSLPDFTSKSYENLTYTIPTAIKHLNINAFYIDKNKNLWICTNATGVFRYEIESGQFEQFTTYDGLAENSVFSILAEQGDSILWLGTGKGLSRMNVNRRWFENYFKEDGLSDNEFNTSSAFRALDGTIYMGGQNGINYFHPDSFKTNTHTIKQYAVISLKNVKERYQHQLLLCPNDSLEIKPKVQIIELTFRSDDFFHASQIHYRYRVAGVIDEWQYLSYSDKAIFPKLPAGMYFWEVQAQNHRGKWSPIAIYTLTILPNWHETGWFKTIIALLACAIIYGFYRLRIRQLRLEFDLRQQISHDLHDELGSRIYLLRSLSDQITNPLTSAEEKQHKIKRLEEISQDTFQSIRDFIWAFDPKQDEVKQLFERMDDFAENYLSPLIRELNIDHAETTIQKRISPRVKHHVMNIYQELLTNMVKHTYCQSIHITLRCYEHTLLVRIANQHTGLKTSEKENLLQHFGQESIQNRLREINGELDWQEENRLQSITVTVSL